jgi:hypothetical protein
MNIVEEMSGLASELPRLAIGIRVDSRPLPSGVTYLNVAVRGRSFVMAYFPREGGIGVDEILQGEGFYESYRHWFTNFAAAKQKLLEMVSDAIRNRGTGQIEFQQPGEGQ